MCGEQSSASTSTQKVEGSSPRVRGADVLDHGLGPLVGIIPARAGSSPERPWHRAGKRDHPRVCGEQFFAAGTPPPAPGSSPRVRGAADVCVRMLSPVGIIPACAGSRRRQASRSRRPWDHPRVCGEQATSPKPFSKVSGSSPRVRGAEYGLHRPFGRAGIIPACAGSSASLRLRC